MIVFLIKNRLIFFSVFLNRIELNRKFASDRTETHLIDGR